MTAKGLVVLDDDSDIKRLPLKQRVIQGTLLIAERDAQVVVLITKPDKLATLSVLDGQHDQDQEEPGYPEPRHRSTL